MKPEGQAEPDRSRCSSNTLLELLDQQAARFDEKLAFAFLEPGESIGAQISFRSLRTRAYAIGAALQRVCRPGDRAVLAYPPGIDFVEAFFGCLCAGVIAVPAYLPEPGNQQRHLARLYAVAEDARPSVILTRTDAIARLQLLLAEDARTTALSCLATDAISHETLGEDAAPPLPTVRPADLATLIYTSGSTGDPKGVCISHENLLHNIELVREKFHNDPDATYVSWLPLFHDLGLIVVMLGALE